MNDLRLPRTFKGPLMTGMAIMMAAGFATAQSSEQLAKADKNGDGRIEWQEITDLRASGFERMDRNKDGVVNKSDSPSFGPGKSRFTRALNDLLANADADGDGSLSKKEMLDAPAPGFTSADKNGDGVLSAEEISTLD